MRLLFTFLATIILIHAEVWASACSRSVEVKRALLRAVGAEYCNKVSQKDLESISELDIYFFQDIHHSRRLLPDDLRGLKSLKWLSIKAAKYESGREIPVELKIPENFLAGTPIEGLQLWGRFKRLGSASFAGAENLKLLSLDHSLIESVESDFLRGAPHLERLHITTSVFPFGSDRAFGSLSELKELRISTVEPQHLSPGSFSDLDQLQQLEIGGQFSFTQGTFKGLNSIKNLILANKKLDRLGPHDFEGLSRLERLTIVSLRWLTVDGEALRGLSSLLKLDISGMNSAPVDLFVDLKKATFMKLIVREKIPGEIFRNQTALESLDLSYEGSSYDPLLLHGLSSAKHITLFGPGFFPDQFFSHAMNLRSLWLTPHTWYTWKTSNAGIPVGCSVCIHNDCGALEDSETED